MFVAGVAWSAWRGVRSDRQSGEVAQELRDVYEQGLRDGSISLDRFRTMRLAQIMGEGADSSWLPRPDGIHLELFGMSGDNAQAELRYRGTDRAPGYCFDVAFSDLPVVQVAVMERC